MRANSTFPQMNFSTINNIRQSVKQNMMSENISSSSTQRQDHSVNPFEDPNMYLGNQTHFSIVPVSDEIKKKLKAIVMEEMIENNGMTGNHSKRVDVKRAYLDSVAPEKRIDVKYTLDRILIDEGRRLVEFVKSKDPNWDFGKPFDKSILEGEQYYQKFDMQA